MLEGIESRHLEVEYQVCSLFCLIFHQKEIGCRESDRSIYLYFLFCQKNMPKPFVIHDPYFEKAKKMGYRARSAFKLLEIQEKYNLIQPKMHVLDVGAAPGSFIQVISRIVDLDHKVVGIDITKIDPYFGRTNIHLLHESIFEYDKVRIFLDSLGVGQFDLITSDIAPSTTGMT